MVDKTGKRIHILQGASLCLVHYHTIVRNFQEPNSLKLGGSYVSVKYRMPLLREPDWHFYSTRNPACPVRKLADGWVSMKTPFGTGEVDGPLRALSSQTFLVLGVRPLFPPREIVAIKAIACELPAAYGRPLSRLFIPDIVDIAIKERVVKKISPATVWRLLDADALKPWRRRSWIWPRDPLFYERAAPALDLYASRWRGKALKDDEFVLSADEKTSIQARRRLHPRRITADGRGQRVEHKYERKGAWAYMAAWDVHRARLFGRVEEKTGIDPFHRLVHQVMRREPYRSARRVFWIVDGGSSHHRSTFSERLQDQYDKAVAVTLPVHASWLNQIEIYFSILQRKVLTPNDFANLEETRDHLMRFGQEFSRHAEPFDWTFTRKNLRDLMAKLKKPKVALRMVIQKSKAA